MTYEIRADVVFWGTQRLKVDVAGFEILHPSVARAGEQILFGAKPARVDAASFQILSAGYAKDGAQAFEILKSKLKPIKGADPATFEALSPTYARDAANGFFRGKRIAKCDPATLVPLHEVFAADSSSVFFINKKITARVEGINLASATVHAQANEVNCPPSVMTDGDAVFIYTMYSNTWLRVEGACADSFRFLEDGRLHGRYQVDRKHLYYHGQVVEGADPATSETFGHGLVRDGTHVWCGTDRLDGLQTVTHDGKTIEHHIGIELEHSGHTGDLYRDSKAVWHIPPPRLSKPFEKQQITLMAMDAVTQSGVHDALDTAYRRIFAFLGSVFKQQPLLLDFQNLPEAVPEPADLRLERTGGCIDVFWKGTRVSSGPISAWLTHASAFWAKAYGRRESLYIYPHTNWLPKGDALHCAVARSCAGELIDLAAALYAEGEIFEAQVIAHLVLYRAMQHKVDAPLLARVPMALVGEGRHTAVHHKFESTTNLAAAREVLRRGVLCDADFRMRYDGLRLLHGVMNDTNKKALFFSEVIPEIITLFPIEQAGFLREMMSAVIEIALVAADVDAEVYHTGHHSAIEPFLHHQIAQGVNTDWNRMRLIECHWAQGRDVQAQMETLLVDCPDGWPAPPRYSHRIGWRHVRLKLMYDRIVAARAHPVAVEPAERSRAVLGAQVAALRKHFGHPEKWDEFTEIDRALETLA